MTTFEQAHLFAGMSYLNGESLLEDANVLFANGRWPRVVFLCCIAEEELAKCAISIMAALKIRLGRFDQSTEKSYREFCIKHTLKTATLNAILDFLFTLRSKTEIVRKMRGRDDRSCDTETVKQASLYVDLKGGVVQSPANLLRSQETVQVVLANTTLLFEVARANIAPILDHLVSGDDVTCERWLQELDGIIF